MSSGTPVAAEAIEAVNSGFADGDYFQPITGRNGRVHIAITAGPNDPPGMIRSACGRLYAGNARHADDYWPRQCDKCWEAM